MTESIDTGVSSIAPARSAGALLRHARQAQGLHIAALAATLKVNQRKLEALENDQFAELPDVAFARALAQAVCRHLKIDALPVLALLPANATEQPGLERVTNGLNTPFREHAQRNHEQGEWPVWLHPQLAVPLLLVLAALAFWFLPKRWVPAPLTGITRAASMPASAPGPVQPASQPSAVQAPAPAASGANSRLFVPATPATEDAALVEPADVLPATGAADEAALPVPPGVLMLRAAGESWIEVVDGNGDVLISRVLAPGEAVGLDGTAPLHLRIGNAEGMQVRFKGRPVRVRMARDNTARLELR